MSFPVVGLLLALWLPTSAAWAQVIVPPNLAPGSKYRLVFVTDSGGVLGKGITQATSGDIATYNTFVKNAANSNATLKALGTTWTAIASTSAVSAKANTSTDPVVNGAGVPIYQLSGLLVAENYGQLWDGSIEKPIKVTEDGEFLTSGFHVWTGTSTSGDASTPLGFASNVQYGDSAKEDYNWTSSDYGDPHVNRRLYAMSGELTVSSVPEPASLGLGLAVALAGTAWWTRRRRLGLR